MSAFLNKAGLTHFWQRIQETIHGISDRVETVEGTLGSLRMDLDATYDQSAMAYSLAGEASIGLNSKVDKVTGKGLSTNDLTDALKEKIENPLPTAITNEEIDSICV